MLRLEGFSGELLLGYLQGILAVSAAHLGFLPLYVFISFLGKKILYTAIAGMASVIISILFVTKEWSGLLPMSIPLLIQFSIMGSNDYTDFWGMTTLPDFNLISVLAVFAVFGSAFSLGVFFLLRKNQGT